MTRGLLWAALALEVGLEILHQCGRPIDPYQHKVLAHPSSADEEDGG